MIPPLTFTVLGNPAPKGSTRAAGNRVIPGGSKQNQIAIKSWDQAVRAAALAALPSDRPMAAVPGDPAILFFKVPIRVSIEFRMMRLRSHFVDKGPSMGRVREDAPRWPIAKPDFDKLLRTTLDAMTGLVFDDDARVVEGVVRKVFATPGQEGAWIRVEEAR